MAKGEYQDAAHIPSHVKRKEVMKRIHEWERFEANCQVLKELDKEKMLQITELRKMRRRSLDNTVKKRVIRQCCLRKEKSMSYPNQLSPV